MFQPRSIYTVYIDLDFSHGCFVLGDFGHDVSVIKLSYSGFRPQKEFPMFQGVIITPDIQ